MPADDHQRRAETFAAAAGLRLPDERLAQLAFGMAAARTAAGVVLSQALGAIEPAFRFRPPPPAGQ